MEKTMRFGGSMEMFTKQISGLHWSWVDKVELWENKISNDPFGWEITFNDAFLKTCH
jgi:hypothetical protein